MDLTSFKSHVSSISLRSWHYYVTGKSLFPHVFCSFFVLFLSSFHSFSFLLSSFFLVFFSLHLSNMDLTSLLSGTSPQFPCSFGIIAWQGRVCYHVHFALVFCSFLTFIHSLSFFLFVFLFATSLSGMPMSSWISLYSVR